MNNFESLPAIEARTRRILTQAYAQARTRGDMVAAILLMHQAIDDALNNHLTLFVPNKADFMVKVEALPPAWPTAARDELEELNRRRRNIAHPFYLAPGFVAGSGDMYVGFLTRHWRLLFQSASPPPRVTAPRLVAPRAASDDDDPGVRLRSILQNEFGQARTPGDRLEALLLFHKALEQSLENRLSPPPAGQSRNFNQKVAQALPGRRDVQEALSALNSERGQLAHPETLDAARIERAAGMMATVIAHDWALWGDGRPAPGVRPVSPRPAPAAPAPRPRPAPARPAAEKQAAPRGPFDWRALLAAVFFAGLALWLLGFTRALWAALPGASRWPALAGAALVLLALWGMARRIAALVRRSGRLRAGLALVMVVALAFNAALLFGWPPAGILSGQRVGRAMIDLLGQVEIRSETPSIPAPAATFAAPTPPVTPLFAAPAPVTPLPVVATAAPPPADPTPAALVVGGRARVVTQGSNLYGRLEPTTAADVAARFAWGTELEVLDGPRVADGYTWWLLRGEAGEGWSADAFLEPIPLASDE